MGHVTAPELSDEFGGNAHCGDAGQAYALPLELSEGLRVWQAIEPANADVAVLDYTDELPVAELPDLDSPLPRLIAHDISPAANVAGCQLPGLCD